MLNRRSLIAAAALGSVVLAVPVANAQDRSILVASTTSTQDFGLFEYLLPLFTKKTGITVKVVAQGTGRGARHRTARRRRRSVRARQVGGGEICRRR